MLIEGYLPEEARDCLSRAEGITEIRLRAGRPVALCRFCSSSLVGPAITPEALRSILSALMEHSLYAYENEMRQGFFTLPDGSRVGVCGECVVQDGVMRAMGEIGSLCVRVAREIRGSGQAAADLLKRYPGDNLLLLSGPGMGKTTMLRDAARILSDGGSNVAVADERGEIAAARSGRPTLDVGCRTDVLDGCPKKTAIPLLVRAMSPEFIVTDELGGDGDAEAVREAARCGVRILASAHAASFEEARERRVTGELLRDGTFRLALLLGQMGSVAGAIMPKEQEGCA